MDSALFRSLTLESQLSIENLGPLIHEIELLMRELAIARWSFLKAWVDDGIPPKDLDGDGLELLFERLCVRWADG